LTDSDRADNKTCLITGANTGLGFGIAVEMAKRGAHVIMACRSQIPEAGEKVKILSGSDKVEMLHLDLSKLESIHQFCNDLEERKFKVDITIFNAGVALPKARILDSGLEEMFMVNYFSNFIFLNLLIEKKIVNSNQENNAKPRILFISSDSHRGSSSIDFDQFGKLNNYGVSKGISYYSYYKLVLNTIAIEFNRRINKDHQVASVHVICPGPVHSNIIREAPFVLRKILGFIFSLVFRSPAVAAKPVVYMSISKTYDNTGQYLHMFNPKEMDPKVYMEEEGEKLWKYSFDLWKSMERQAVEII